MRRSSACCSAESLAGGLGVCPWAEAVARERVSLELGAADHVDVGAYASFPVGSGSSSGSA